MNTDIADRAARNYHLTIAQMREDITDALKAGDYTEASDLRAELREFKLRGDDPIF